MMENNAINEHYQRVHVLKTQSPGAYTPPDYSIHKLSPPDSLLLLHQEWVMPKVPIPQQKHMEPTPSEAGLTGPNILKKPARVGGKAHDTLQVSQMPLFGPPDYEAILGPHAQIKALKRLETAPKRRKKPPLNPH